MLDRGLPVVIDRHQAAERLARSMSERDLLQAVRDCARSLGWMTYHTHSSRRSEEGFPDVILARQEADRVAAVSLDGGQSFAGVVDRVWGPWYDERQLRDWLQTQQARGLMDGYEVITHIRHRSIMVAVELKTERGQPTPAQAQWLELFERLLPTAVWRPRHWLSGEILAYLQGHGRLEIPGRFGV
jgi:hypothetical protein